MLKKVCPICQKILLFKDYTDYANHITKEAEKVDAANQAAEKKKVAEQKAVAEKEQKRLADLNAIRKYYEALRDKVAEYNKAYKNESIVVSMEHKGKDTVNNKTILNKNAHKNSIKDDNLWDILDDLYLWF